MRALRENDVNKVWLATCLTMILQACGAAHVKTESHTADLHQYDSVYISVVKVYSLEPHVKDSRRLQALILDWQKFATRELRNYVQQSHYQLVGADQLGKPLVLNVDLDINVRFGSRGLRYWVGFGAGSGSIDSTLTVSDSTTGQQKLRVVAESDLAIGAWGGSIEEALKENIKELIDQFPDA